MVKFSDENKKDTFQGNYFEEGVHKVKIIGADLGKTDSGKEYLEFGVTDEEGRKEDAVRFWFTTDGAINYSFGIIRGIFVHNAPDGKKDEVRAKFDEIEDTDQLVEKCNELLTGKEAWYKVEKDPSRTYAGKDGQLRPSYNRNLYGYDPGSSKKEQDSEVEDVEVEDKPKAKSSKKDDGEKVTGF